MTSLAVAPWRKALLADLASMSEPYGVLATIEPRSALHPLRPRARTVAFRSMFGSLVAHPANAAPLNPAAFESDLLTITTDVRMDKVSQLFGGTESPPAGSGGGGPAELVFWAEPAKTQWRIAGHAYVLGPDADEEAARPVREALLARMRPVGSGADVAAWSWSREVTAWFGNVKPDSRGWFRNPPPGRPVSEPVQDHRLGLGQVVDDLEDEVARAHFRLVVVVPYEVDRVHLASPGPDRRWNYLLGADGEWQTTEVWP